MKRAGIVIGLLLSLGVIEAAAQSFSFYSTLQAGQQNSNDWEIGIGTPGSAPSATSDYGYNATGQQYWNPASGGQTFRIGWDATTNTAYTTVFKANGTATSVTMQNTGTALSANTIWTLPASSFVANATPNGGSNATTSIQFSGLSISPGVAVTGTLPSTFGASQSGSAVSNSLSAPLLLNASGAAGSWYIQGTVQFTGLITQGGNARGSQLQFLLGAVGTDTPEGSSLGLMGGGLLALGLFNRSRRNGKRK